MREPVFSGAFYPQERESLEQEVTHYIHQANVTPSKHVVNAIISPHAGYMYSGAVAGHGMRAIQNQTYDTVIVMGPSHRHYFEGASVYEGAGYLTPLGGLYTNTFLADTIRNAHPQCGFDPQAHAQEHGIEVQLPFLTVALGYHIELVSIVMGSCTRSFLDDLAATLATICRNAKVLLVASTDFSHFYTYAQAMQMDARAIALIKAGDLDTLWQEDHDKKIQLCGLHAVMVTATAMQKLGVNPPQLLKTCNSGDISGDHGSVVGYASMLYASEEG